MSIIKPKKWIGTGFQDKKKCLGSTLKFLKPLVHLKETGPAICHARSIIHRLNKFVCSLIWKLSHLIKNHTCFFFHIPIYRVYQSYTSHIQTVILFQSPLHLLCFTVHLTCSQLSQQDPQRHARANKRPQLRPVRLRRARPRRGPGGPWFRPGGQWRWCFGLGENWWQPCLDFFV